MNQVLRYRAVFVRIYSERRIEKKVRDVIREQKKAKRINLDNGSIDYPARR